MTRLQKAAIRLKTIHGSWRKAEAATGVNYNYLFRMARGEKTNPSAEVLAVLGLERRETFVRRVNNHAE
jgi:hypothetical protein